MGASAGGGMGGGSSGEMNGAPRQTSMGGNTGSGMGVNNPYAFGPQGSYGSTMGGFQGGNRFGGGFQRGFGSFGGGMGGMGGMGSMSGMGGQAQQNQITDPQTGRSFIPGGPVPQDIETSSAYTRAMRANEASLQPTQQLAPSQSMVDAFNQRNVAPSPQDMGNMQNLHSAFRNDMRFQRPSQNQFSPMMNSGGFGMQQPIQGFGQMGNRGIGGAMNYMSGPRASNIGSMLSLLGMR